jgi:hypothetical protein
MTGRSTFLDNSQNVSSHNNSIMMQNKSLWDKSKEEDKHEQY